jgi:type IV secretory pathway VirB3-like protein
MAMEPTRHEVYHVMVKPMLIGGVERQFLYAVAGVTVLSWVITERLMVMLAVGAIGWWIGRRVAQADDRFLVIVRKTWRERTRYDAAKRGRAC